MSEKNKKNNSLWLLLLLLIGLIGVSIYAFKQKSSLNDLTGVHQDLKTEFEKQLVELDRLKSDNAGLQNKLEGSNQEIEKLKKQIAQLANKNKLSAKEIVTLTKKIGELNNQIEEYKNRIAELESQVNTLQTEKKELTDKNQALTDTNTDLKNKVNQASQIRAINLTTSFVKKTWFFGSKEKPTTNGEKVSKVVLSFFLQNNFLAQDGTKELFISIMQPNGEVLTDKELSSGSQDFDYNGEKISIKYTQKVTINYEKKLANKVTTVFEPDAPMLPGKYEVLVYDSFGNIISDRAAFYFDLLKGGQ